MSHIVLAIVFTLTCELLAALGERERGRGGAAAFPFLGVTSGMLSQRERLMNVENENTSLMNSVTQLVQLIFLWRRRVKMESRLIEPLFRSLILFLGSCHAMCACVCVCVWTYVYERFSQESHFVCEREKEIVFSLVHRTRLVPTLSLLS